MKVSQVYGVSWWGPDHGFSCIGIKKMRSSNVGTDLILVKTSKADLRLQNLHWRFSEARDYGTFSRRFRIAVVKTTPLRRKVWHFGQLRKERFGKDTNYLPHMLSKQLCEKGCFGVMSAAKSQAWIEFVQILPVLIIAVSRNRRRLYLLDICLEGQLFILNWSCSFVTHVLFSGHIKVPYVSFWSTLSNRCLHLATLTLGIPRYVCVQA